MASTKKPNIPGKITFHYETTNNYRSYHVDGMFGGMTVSGKLYVEIFSQKTPLPTSVEQKVNSDGTLGPETGREVKSGIIKQVEAGLIMDLEVAKSFRDWIDRTIRGIEKGTVQ